MFRPKVNSFCSVRPRLLLCGVLLGRALADGQSGEYGPRVSITPRAACSRFPSARYAPA
jgi:hypothetical protein